MHKKDSFLFTSESVTEGHADKISDQVSDLILDEALKQDADSRVACEAFVGLGFIMVSGEIQTRAYIEIQDLVRNLIKDIGYNKSHYGFSWDSCSIMNMINKQSPDIARGVNHGGAGDQGSMFGYATNETPEYMPMPIMLAHRLTKGLADLRKKDLNDFLGPDGKSQVTIEYEDDKPIAVQHIVLSAQHTEDIGLEELKSFLWTNLIDIIIPKEMRSKSFQFLVNPTGRFVLGGPAADTGLTGRKIMVDSYGGFARHGGGAFSGKDPTKVDRTASYMARYLAKNLVAAGICKRCEIQLAYVIGCPDPISIFVDSFSTSALSNKELAIFISKNFDLSVKSMIKQLNLLKTCYKDTATYGHFGRSEFSWEKLDQVDYLKGIL